MTIIASYGREPGYPTFIESSNGNAYSASYKDKWKVLLNSGNENLLPEFILDELPSDFQLGAQLGQYTNLASRSLKRDDKNRLLYYLDLDFNTDVDEGGVGGGSVSPDQRPAKWAWDYEQYSAVMRKDADGLPVVNSVDEPVEATADFALPILTIERFQSFFDASSILGYVNHRNSQAFWGSPASTVVCIGIRDREGETYQGFTYRLVTYTFKFFVPYIQGVLEGATEILLNAGHRYRPTAGAQPVESRTLVNLATDGTKLAIGATPIYGRFQKHPLANFDGLGVNIYQI